MLGADQLDLEDLELRCLAFIEDQFTDDSEDKLIRRYG